MKKDDLAELSHSKSMIGNIHSVPVTFLSILKTSYNPCPSTEFVDSILKCFFQQII